MDWRAAYLYLEDQQESILRTLADRLVELEEAPTDGAAVLRRVELTRLEKGNASAIIVADGARLEYAFYLYRGDEVVERRDYTLSNTAVFRIRKSGVYRVRGFVRHVGAKEIVGTQTSGETEV